MNQSVMFAMLAIVTGSLALPVQENGRFLFDGYFSRVIQCNRAISPDSDEKEAVREATIYCLSGPDQRIENTVMELSSFNSRSSEEAGSLESASREAMALLGLADHIDSAFIPEDREIARLAGYGFRMCIEDRLGMVDDDGDYDQGALEGWIMMKVAGLGDRIGMNTDYGINECGVVEDFKVMEYLNCVRHYCAKGGDIDGPAPGPARGPGRKN